MKYKSQHGQRLEVNDITVKLISVFNEKEENVFDIFNTGIILKNKNIVLSATELKTAVEVIEDFKAVFENIVTYTKQ